MDIVLVDNDVHKNSAILDSGNFDEANQAFCDTYRKIKDCLTAAFIRADLLEENCTVDVQIEFVRDLKISLRQINEQADILTRLSFREEESSKDKTALTL